MRARVPLMLRMAIRRFFRVFRNPFRRRGGGGPVEKGKLVGMYLQQTNHKDHYAPEHLETRTRRNSKYSFKRERH